MRGQKIITREMAHQIYYSYEALRLDKVKPQDAFEMIQSDVFLDFGKVVPNGTTRNFIYRTFDEFVESRTNYQKSKKFKDAQRNYWQSDKGEANQKRYRESKKGKEKNRRCQKNYRERKALQEIAIYPQS